MHGKQDVSLDGKTTMAFYIFIQIIICTTFYDTEKFVILCYSSTHTPIGTMEAESFGFTPTFPVVDELMTSHTVFESLSKP